VHPFAVGVGVNGKVGRGGASGGSLAAVSDLHAVDSRFEIRHQMIPRGGHLQLDVMQIAAVFGGDGRRNIHREVFVFGSLHHVADNQQRFVIGLESNLGRNVVVGIFGTINKHRAVTPFGYLQIEIYQKEGAVFGELQLRRTNPLGTTPSRPHKAGFEPRGLGTDRRPLFGIDSHLPEVTGRRPQHTPAIRNPHRKIGYRFPAVVHKISCLQRLFTLSHHNPVRRLSRPNSFRCQLPPKARTLQINPQRSRQILSSQCHHRIPGLRGSIQRGCPQSCGRNQCAPKQEAQTERKSMEGFHAEKGLNLVP